MALIDRTRNAVRRIDLSRIPLPHVNETRAYAALLALALITRLWDLGGRALHYDEILHAWYSWRFV